MANYEEKKKEWKEDPVREYAWRTGWLEGERDSMIRAFKYIRDRLEYTKESPEVLTVVVRELQFLGVE
jgi:hypothetical protein